MIEIENLKIDINIARVLFNVLLPASSYADPYM
jgi:hypothetical protein